MAPDPPSISHEREALWRRVHLNIVQHAIPDSRFDYDFSSFIPDFGGSSSAIDRVAELPCYKSANTVLITPDNSLEQLRYRALKDGKRVLVATHKLRRGFVLLDPKRISEENLVMASWLDGMERPGIGRPITLTQMEERIDLCVTGVLAVSGHGVTIKRSPQHFEIQWGMLLDRKILDRKTPVVAVAHGCQVVDEEEIRGTIELDRACQVTPDFIVTPEKVFEVEVTNKLATGIQFDTIDPMLLATLPPLQELKGIRMMEQIMNGAGFAQEVLKPSPPAPNPDEQIGISIVERLMKGYKA